MFESIIKTTETSITALPAIIIIVEAFVMGMIIGLCYMLTQKKYDYSKEYIVAIAILPSIVALSPSPRLFLWLTRHSFLQRRNHVQNYLVLH